MDEIAAWTRKQGMAGGAASGLGSAATREIARVSVEVAMDDGTVMTFAADRPYRAEIDIGAALPLAPFSAQTAPFRIEPPPVRRASVSFEANPQRPMAIEIRLPGAAVAPAEVWVAETWRAHGYGRSVHGVYDSREAAFEALRDEPGMTVWVDERGTVRGRPRDDEQFGATWAMAAPRRVQARAA